MSSNSVGRSRRGLLAIALGASAIPPLLFVACSSPSSDLTPNGTPDTGASGQPSATTSGTSTSPIPTSTSTSTGGGDGGLQLPTSWLTSSALYEDATMIAEKVTYLSGGLKVVGQVCHSKAPGRHPVVIQNHGGFVGFGVDTVTQGCKDTGKNAAVLVQASYRGEEGSEGKVEVCLGEVDDVLAMTSVVLAQPYADPNKVFMWGGSHGGCITLRAVQRGAPIQLADEVAGPTDWAADYAMWKTHIVSVPPGADAGPESNFFSYLAGILDTAIGGPPEQFPDEYKKRSPLTYAKDLNAFQHPFLFEHGAIDAIVLPSDTCRLAALMPGIAAFRTAADGGTDPAPMPGCETSGLKFSSGPRPTPTWPGERYAVFYDGLGHEALRGPSAEDLLTFYLARLPP